jgi:hypothetical protein
MPGAGDTNAEYVLASVNEIAGGAVTGKLVLVP